MIFDIILCVAAVIGVLIGLKKGFYKLAIKPLLFWIALGGGFAIAFLPMLSGGTLAPTLLDDLFIGFGLEAEIATYISSAIIGILLAIIFRIVVGILLGSSGALLKHSKAAQLINRLLGIVAGAVVGAVLFAIIFALMTVAGVFSADVASIVNANDGFINIVPMLNEILINNGINIPEMIKGYLVF